MEIVETKLFQMDLPAEETRTGCRRAHDTGRESLAADV